MNAERKKSDPAIRKKDPPWFWISVVAASGVLVLFIIVSVVQAHLVRKRMYGWDDDTLSAIGVSGDFFGLANSVFSALAFAMIIVTLWMQKHELAQQRQELEDNRKVMSLQQKEMKQQNESLRRQRFESTFFNMLNLYGEIVATISIGDSVVGRHGFVLFSESLNQLARDRGDSEPSIETYELWYRKRDYAIGHYFRTLYNVFRFIDESGGDEKTMYARLVRAQLSRDELKLLAFNGLGQHGREKFRPLIEKYSLLKHLPPGSVSDDLLDRYESIAFGRSIAS